MLKSQGEACRGCRHLTYCGVQVCNSGFMKMMGIGKSRFQTLGRAARAGWEHCPYDNRFIPKGPQQPSEKRLLVHQFLSQLYATSAEPIPDGLNSNKRPRQGKHKYDKPGMKRDGIKHLPHGSINDYYVQCTALHPGVTISKKLFSSVTCPTLSILIDSTLIFPRQKYPLTPCREFVSYEWLYLRYGRMNSKTNFVSASRITTQSAVSV